MTKLIRCKKLHPTTFQYNCWGENPNLQAESPTYRLRYLFDKPNLRIYLCLYVVTVVPPYVAEPEQDDDTKTPAELSITLYTLQLQLPAT